MICMVYKRKKILSGLKMICVICGHDRRHKTVRKSIYNRSKLKLFDKVLTQHHFKDITFVRSYLNCFEVFKNYSIYAQTDRTEGTG